MSLVDHTVEDGVHTVTLTDPGRRNALSWQLLDELTAIVSAIKVDVSARVVVIAGEGPAFCAGADLDDIFGDLPDDPADRRAHLRRVYTGFLDIRHLPVPCIAVLDGAAVGAGLNLALACDLVVASPRARLVPSFAEIGLHPGGGCSYFLTERAGSHRATALLLLAAPVSAAEALSMGLIEYLADDPNRLASELAATIAARSPELARSIKRTVAAADRTGLATTIELEAWAQAESLDSPRFREHLSRFAGRTR